MCSIGEDDYGDDGGLHAMVPQKADMTNITTAESNIGVCNKCSKKVNDIYKLHFREPTCRDCFLNYARHKFRAALGSSKVLPRGSRVLIAVDGSAESLVLLDMLYYSQTQNTHKRLHCTAMVLFVDESVVGVDMELDMLNKLKSKYNLFEFYYIPLETDVTNVAHQLKKLSDVEENYKEKENLEFLIKVNAIRSLTSRQDYIQQRRKTLVGEVTQHLKCKFIFVPTINTSLAAHLLASVALGRGGSAALDVALIDDRFSNGIQLVRPLKDLTEVDVKLYLRAQELNPFREVENYGDDMSSNASLQNLTRAFVNNLQQNFTSTVSTVARTGGKIAPKRNINHLNDCIKNVHISNDEDTVETTSICSFCKSPLDYFDSKTLLAIEFSGVVSAGGGQLFNKCKDLEKQALNQLRAEDNKTRRRLCHSCRNIQDDFENKNDIL